MRADLLREAYQTTKASLKAIRKDRASWKGKFTDEKQQPDHNARLRAVQEAQSLAGVDKTKEPVVKVSLNLITPSWAIATSKDTGRVIEGKTPKESMPGDDARRD